MSTSRKSMKSCQQQEIPSIVYSHRHTEYLIVGLMPKSDCVMAGKTKTAALILNIYQQSQSKPLVHLSYKNYLPV